MRNAIVVDIETTGYLKKDEKYIDGELTYVLSDKSEILSVGYIRVDLDTERIFDAGVLYFYKPYFEIENQAQSVHGLQRSFLEQFEDQFDDNLAMLETLLYNTVIIGKNSDAFDVPFLDAFLLKHRGPTPLYSYINLLKMKNYEGGRLVLKNETTAVDVQTSFAPLYRRLMHDVKGVELSSRKKGTLTEYLDLLDPDRVSVNSLVKEVKELTSDEFVASAHDAMYDACATWLVYVFLQKVLDKAKSIKTDTVADESDKM